MTKPLGRIAKKLIARLRTEFPWLDIPESPNIERAGGLHPGNSRASWLILNSHPSIYSCETMTSLVKATRLCCWAPTCGWSNHGYEIGIAGEGDILTDQGILCEGMRHPFNPTNIPD